MITPTRQTVTLEAVRDETHDVKTFVFSTEYAFEPGQFVNLRFSRDDDIGRRSFSVASGPGERLEITAKAIGRFTNALFAAPIGTEFEVLGPLGLPYVRGSHDEAYLLIAGGSGIAPFRSLMRSREHADLRMTLVDSNKTFGDIIYANEMDAWPAEIVHTLTRETRDGMRHGRIARDTFAAIEALEQRRVMICGPSGLVTSAVTILTSLGVPSDRIRTESWGL